MGSEDTGSTPSVLAGDNESGCPSSDELAGFPVPDGDCSFPFSNQDPGCFFESLSLAERQTLGLEDLDLMYVYALGPGFSLRTDQPAEDLLDMYRAPGEGWEPASSSRVFSSVLGQCFVKGNNVAHVRIDEISTDGEDPYRIVAATVIDKGGLLDLGRRASISLTDLDWPSLDSLDAYTFISDDQLVETSIITIPADSTACISSEYSAFQQVLSFRGLARGDGAMLSAREVFDSLKAQLPDWEVFDEELDPGPQSFAFGPYLVLVKDDSLLHVGVFDAIGESTSGGFEAFLCILEEVAGDAPE